MQDAHATIESDLMCHHGNHTPGLHGLAGVLHTSISESNCALLPVSAKHGEIARDCGSN